MATKKPAKPTSTALTIWEEEMAQAAIAQGSTEEFQGGFKSINTRGGILKIDDEEVEGNELRVIILSSVHENQLYENAFDPNEKATPICYAFGLTDDDMVPHKEAPAPQHQNCEECPMNQWASADKGKGKACKNVRRLVCVTEDALENAEALEDAEARMLKLPVTSVKNWTNYVKNILVEQIRRPSWGVITTVKLIPDAKSQFKVTFKFEELVPFTDALYPIMKKRAKLAEESSMQAYVEIVPEDKPAKSARKAPVRKAAANQKQEPADPYAGRDLPAADKKTKAAAKPATQRPAIKGRGGKY
jgi:hypothetical protein